MWDTCKVSVSVALGHWGDKDMGLFIKLERKKRNENQTRWWILKFPTIRISLEGEWVKMNSTLEFKLCIFLHTSYRRDKQHINK